MWYWTSDHSNLEKQQKNLHHSHTYADKVIDSVALSIGTSTFTEKTVFKEKNNKETNNDAIQPISSYFEEEQQF